MKMRISAGSAHDNPPKTGLGPASPQKESEACAIIPPFFAVAYAKDADRFSSFLVLEANMIDSGPDPESSREVGGTWIPASAGKTVG